MHNVTRPAPAQDGALEPRLFLLRQVADAPGGTLAQASANRSTPAAARSALGLDARTANRLRSELVVEGLLAAAGRSRSPTFSLTERGRDLLALHAGRVPVFAAGRRGAVRPPSNDRVRDLRVAYLLLQLLRAPRYTLGLSDANTFDALGRRLDLNAATARHVRHELAARGDLAVSGQGRAEAYALTPAGRLRLGTLALDDDFTFRLPGRVLNDLLEAAREAAKQFSPEPVARPAATSADVTGALLAAFDELLRERHGHTRMVPVHEVRATVARARGADAARHDVFDPAVLSLRQAGRVRLVPITDLARATAAELEDSIPGVGETLFFLEPAREPAPA